MNRRRSTPLKVSDHFQLLIHVVCRHKKKSVMQTQDSCSRCPRGQIHVCWEAEGKDSSCSFRWRFHWYIHSEPYARLLTKAFNYSMEVSYSARRLFPWKSGILQGGLFHESLVFTQPLTGKDYYRATSAVTRDLAFCDLIRRTGIYSYN